MNKKAFIKAKVVRKTKGKNRREQDAEFTKKFDDYVLSCIASGLTDEEIWQRIRSDPVLRKADGPNYGDLWRGRVRQLRKGTLEGWIKLPLLSNQEMSYYRTVRRR